MVRIVIPYFMVISADISIESQQYFLLALFAFINKGESLP